MLMRPGLCAFLLLTALAVLPAQDLLYSLAADLPGPAAPWQRNEIQRLLPGGGSTPFLPDEAWQVLFGDRDGNGVLDDPPTDVDAMHVAGPGGLTSWLFSTTTTVNLVGSGSLRDGDIFSFDGAGGIQIVHGEDALAAATGTSAIDVDAFCVGTGAEIYFSFAEDETTTVASLITQNGGNAVIDEQSVFRLDAGAATAVLHFTKDQVVAIFNQALSTAVTTVVDVTGITMDPAGAPGELLLIAGSTSASLRGRVVSSFGGGTVFSVGGAPVEPTLLGIGSPTRLDALAWTLGPPPPVVRTLPGSGSVSAAGPGRIEVHGLLPGEMVQLVLTNPRLPGPFAWTDPSAGGFEVLTVDPLDSLFYESFSVTDWLLVADAQGVATYLYDFMDLPPGTAAVVQGVTLPGALVTTPGTVDVLP